ncbi:hypothetical protein QWZ06_00245 [Chryseobacterium tructae]|uniref:TonB C-terminal domain-containing protein n=1 Tax=Chryseobacterium tructae TaxID=1037380 RepID=A0ABV7XRB7_9FLAO|nr:hypothetical protein [Chryseobacterium tructae]MDN3690810.1 hypothetical protein [Chryseobacterium tructae]
MNKKLLTTFLLTFSFLTTWAQKPGMTDYPSGQDAYRGGNVQMFKDIQTFFLKNKLSGCENKKEIYWVTLRIDENAKPVLVRKKNDIESAEKNKCAYGLIVKALGTLKDWQPAKVDDKNITAYIDFPFIPSDFFENYKENYDTRNFISRPSFPPNGMISFRDEVGKNVSAYLNYDLYKVKGIFTVFFTIDTDGSTNVIDVEPKVANSERLIEDIKFGFKKVKQKWIPATRNGVPVKVNNRIGLKFSENLD